MKGVGFEEASWYICDRELNEDVIKVTTKDRIPTYIHDELEDNKEEYCSITHEEWCNLLSTMGVNDNRKRDASQIKRLVIPNEAPVNYDSDESVRVPYKNRARTGVITSRRQQGKKTLKHHGAQRYCVFCKKAGMPDKKYMSHSSDNCFGKIYDKNYIK